jgi:tRNA A-37 threonylcarbamoyl transferase component Bud32
MTELPTTFGKYFLTEKLATGGMAEIYLAKLVGPGGFEKPLVIKQIHPKLSGQRHFVDLFVAEAKILVGLAHGNIVPIYELGVIDDTYFIAMDYIDGPTLYRLTEALARQDHRMEPAIAAWIAAKILEGLDYAHRKGEGVIHRDLSPRNVMLSRDGEVKLVDFGIAVTLGAVDAGSDVQSAPTGSFPYMSPEQVRREPLTGQTDLFSVGVLLWEMLVGTRLFARADADATLAAVTDGPIGKPSSKVAGIPARLDDVVMRALERDQSARWASSGEMLAALQRYLYNLDATPSPRDIAAMVAKYCPAETRRLSTHADHTPSSGVDVEPPAGPRTAVIERADAKPRGKARARTETFATHVDLETILARETPLVGVDVLPSTMVSTPALVPAGHPSSIRSAGQPSSVRSAGQPSSIPPGEVDDDPFRDPTPVPPPTPMAGDDDEDDNPSASKLKMRAPRESITTAQEIDRLPVSEVRPPRQRSVRPDSEPVRDKDERPNLPGREAPNRPLLVLAALGTVVLGIGAVYIFSRGKSGVMRPDAQPKLDAPFYAFEPDAPPDTLDPLMWLDAGAPTSPDAPPADAPSVDARVAIEPPRDAGRVRPDAGTPDAAIVTPVGTATLTIGASPWGDIVIDGVKRGRTPSSIEVSAGKHVVELIFSGDDPPVKKSYPIDVKPGQTLPIQADFTK